MSDDDDKSVQADAKRAAKKERDDSRARKRERVVAKRTSKDRRRARGKKPKQQKDLPIKQFEFVALDSQGASIKGVEKESDQHLDQGES